jgi:uncharacterized protein DUF6544
MKSRYAVERRQLCQIIRADDELPLMADRRAQFATCLGLLVENPKAERLLQPKKELKRISGARPPGIDGLRLDPSVSLPDNQRLHVLLFHSTRARLNCEIPIRENDNVRVGSGETTAEVALSLDGQGRIVGAFAPDRPRSAKAPYLPAPWRGRFSDYRCHNDMWLPFAGEVGWEIDCVEEIYWQGRMEHWDTQNDVDLRRVRATSLR